MSQSVKEKTSYLFLEQVIKLEIDYDKDWFVAKKDNHILFSGKFSVFVKEVSKFKKD